MKSKKILVTGVSGTGKSTVCHELAKQGIYTVGIDEEPGLSYWVNKQTKEKLSKKADFTEAFLATHEWVCDMDRLDALTKDVDRTVVICGNVENIQDCIDFCDTTLLLVCSLETLFARIDAREDNEYGKSDDAKDFIRGYVRELEDVCMNSGAQRIDAERSLEEVVNEIMTYTA